MPAHEVGMALATIELTNEQKRDSSLDILTGFVFRDKHICIAVVEGLAGRGIKR